MRSPQEKGAEYKQNQILGTNEIITHVEFALIYHIP